MKISGVNSCINAYSIVKQTKIENADFEIKKEQSSNSIQDYNEAAKTGSVDSVQQSTSDPILDYYHQLCSQYPDVTFRLDDVETGRQRGRGLGYKDSMNQVGDNFGSVGQCSISIDVKVIEHMMEDSKYAAVAGVWIEESIKNYSLYEEDTQMSGMKYTSVQIEDDNGRAVPSVMSSNLPYSTDEEVRAIWAEEDGKSTAGVITKQLTENGDMFDRFLEMFDKSQEKHREMIREYYDKLHDEDSRHFPEQKPDAGLDDQKKAVIHNWKAVNEYDKHFAYDNA